jgi:hypothetical protein
MRELGAHEKMVERSVIETKWWTARVFIDAVYVYADGRERTLEDC